MSSSDKGFRQGAIVPREALKWAKKKLYFSALYFINTYIFQHSSQKRFGNPIMTCSLLKVWIPCVVSPQGKCSKLSSRRNKQEKSGVVTQRGKVFTKQSVKTRPTGVISWSWLDEGDPALLGFLSFSFHHSATHQPRSFSGRLMCEPWESIGTARVIVANFSNRTLIARPRVSVNVQGIESIPVEL